MCEFTFEEFTSISNRKEPENKECPHCKHLGCVEQKIGAPMVVDPYLVGRIPVNGKLRDKFQQIHEKTHGSVLDKASTITKL
jgi:hypothetical protein